MIDAWSKDLIYIDRPNADSGNAATDQILRTSTTPLDHTIASLFVEDLKNDERMLLDALASGYALKEVYRRNAISAFQMKSIRSSLKAKAVSHLL